MTLETVRVIQQLWPNVQNPIVIQVIINALFLKLMASVPNSTYAAKSCPVPLPDVELALSVDPSLAYENPTQETIHRPPGVATLRQWGNQVFPEGKYQGTTFIAVYNKDQKYTAYMKGHSHLTSAWAKSFQNFVKAMHMPMGSQQTPCLTPKGTTSPSASEWDLLSSPGLSQAPTCQNRGKRGQIESEMEGEIAKMDLEKDRDKEQMLESKIAILQRELDRLKQDSL